MLNDDEWHSSWINRNLRTRPLRNELHDTTAASPIQCRQEPTLVKIETLKVTPIEKHSQQIEGKEWLGIYRHVHRIKKRPCGRFVYDFQQMESEPS